MAAICKTVAPLGITGGLTDFMFERGESTGEPALVGAESELRSGTNDFDERGKAAGFSGSPE
jgi:hypothetical protein